VPAVRRHRARQHPRFAVTSSRGCSPHRCSTTPRPGAEELGDIVTQPPPARAHRRRHRVCRYRPDPIGHVDHLDACAVTRNGLPGMPCPPNQHRLHVDPGVVAGRSSPTRAAPSRRSWNRPDRHTTDVRAGVPRLSADAGAGDVPANPGPSSKVCVGSARNAALAVACTCAGGRAFLAHRSPAPGWLIR